MGCPEPGSDGSETATSETASSETGAITSGSSESTGDNGGPCPPESIYEGDLEIEDTTDLESLSGVCEVTGFLTVGPTTELASLAGLEQLTLVGGGVLILDNETLPSLTGLNGLTSIESDLEIRRNVSLSSLEGLENLAEVSDLRVSENPLVTDLLDLPAELQLTHLGASHTIREMPLLVDLSGFPRRVPLDERPASVHIHVSDSNLVSLNGIQGCCDDIEEVSVFVETSPSFTSLAALSEFTSLGSLVIGDNDAFMDLTGVENIVDVYYLTIRGNATLPSLVGLESLETAEGTLELGLACDESPGPDEDNPAIVSFEGLESVTRITALHVEGQSSLASLAGLENVTSLQEAIFRNNPNLPTDDIVAFLDAYGVDHTEPAYLCGNFGGDPCVACPPEGR